MPRSRIQSVYDHEIPPCRMTGEGARLLCMRYALPVIAVLFALDLVIWAVLRLTIGSCYGVWCWF